MDDSRWDAGFGLALAGGLPIAVGAVLVPLRDSMAPANVALALVVAIVVAALAGGRLAGAIAAVTSALSFDFFHVRPYLSLTIDSRDDVETTILLLAVGIIVGTLSSRASRARASAAAGRDEVRRIHRIAELVAGGAEGADVVAAVERELTDLLSLASCRFDAGAGGGDLPRLERSGVIGGVHQYRMAPEGFELPEGGVELAVLARGQQVGRFVLVPRRGVGVSLDQRVVAVALADQVGGAVAGDRT